MVAVYARQSVDKKDSMSIESQIEICQKQVLTETKIYKDKGYSGKNLHRPAFEQLMSDVCNGAIEKILVYRLDRFSRSIADFGRVWELLEKHSVQFESVTEKFDTSTPMGRAMLNIIMTFAQLERETIAERVRDNYYHRFSLGSWPGGPAPMGFDIARTETDDGRKVSCLKPNNIIKTVIAIFEKYGYSKLSLGEVARSLNDLGVEGARRATWDNVRVSRILRNPVYVLADEDIYWYYKSKGVEISQPISAFTGIYGCNLVGKRNASTRKYNKVSIQKLSLANHLGCINSELFLKCQYKLEGNRQIDRSSVGKHSWLSGLLKCKSCGYAIKINKQGENLFLLCSGRSNLKICSESFQINIRELESSVQSEIEQLVMQCSPEDLIKPKFECASKEMATIDSKIERLVSALSECGEISVQYINNEIERLDKERKQILQEQNSTIIRKRAKELSNLDFEMISFEERKVVASIFIDRILLSGSTAEILWKI